MLFNYTQGQWIYSPSKGLVQSASYFLIASGDGMFLFWRVTKIDHSHRKIQYMLGYYNFPNAFPCVLALKS